MSEPPVVAIVSNSLTPYRLSFHRRLIREVPGISWGSLFTHDISNAPWQMKGEAEIRPIKFGPGEPSEEQSDLKNVWHEYRKGGRLIEWMKANRAAAVVLLGYNDPGRIRLIRWCRANRVPCFLSGDSNIRGDRGGRLKRMILTRILAQCSGALACGRLGRDYFKSYGVPEDRVWFMPYEPDYDLIASITSADVRQHFADLPQRRFILYCGRLAPVKRVDLLIDSFAAIASERPDWNLLMVGGGPLRDSLIQRVPPELASRIHWLGFIDDQRRISSLMAGSEVLVLPSNFEPWGVVVNEAVAAGVAVVTTNIVGSAYELVRDRVNGRIVAPDDPAGLTEALADTTLRAAEYRAACPAVLAEWLQIGNPIQGVLAALASVGVKPAG